MIDTLKPPRATLIVASLAVVAAVGMHALSWLATAAGMPSARLSGYAATFEALPLWLVIGTVMHQVGAAIDAAWTARNTPARAPHGGWNDDETRGHA